jgi:hypothetical protein
MEYYIPPTNATIFAMTNELPKIIIGSILSITISVINIITFVIIKQNKESLDTHSVIIASLCVADVCNGIGLFFYVTKLSSICGYSRTAMDLFTFFGAFVSQWHTVCLSIDRLIAIQWALRYHLIMTPCKFWAMIISAWMIGFAEAMLVVFTVYFAECTSGYNAPKGFRHVYPPAHKLFIFTIIAIIYAQLWRVARRQKRQIMAQQQQQQQQQPRKQAFDKASFIVFVIVGLFLLLWSPYMVCSLIIVTSTDETLHDAVVDIEDDVVIVGYLNSIINCIIYVLLNKKLRNHLKKLLNVC